VSFADLTTDPPKGFHVTQSGDGYPKITYRYWSAVSVFTFRPDRLVVERRGFFGYDRREFPKQAIHALRQVPNAVDWESLEYGPTWDLFIEWGEGRVKATLLSGQLLDKSDWLGPIVARWAGVAFDQWSSSK
jgi:hypothetical protein